MTSKRSKAGVVVVDADGQPVQSRARAKLEAICDRIAAGTHQNHACALEGVPRQTYYDLLSADREAAAQVAQARAVAAEAMRQRVQLVAEGGGGERANANVLLHLLERAHPDEYGPPKQRVEQSGPEGKPIAHAVQLVGLEEAKRIARAKDEET